MSQFAEPLTEVRSHIEQIAKSEKRAFRLDSETARDTAERHRSQLTRLRKEMWKKLLHEESGSPVLYRDDSVNALIEILRYQYPYNEAGSGTTALQTSEPSRRRRSFIGRLGSQLRQSADEEPSASRLMPESNPLAHGGFVYASLENRTMQTREERDAEIQEFKRILFVLTPDEQPASEQTASFSVPNPLSETEVPESHARDELRKRRDELEVQLESTLEAAYYSVIDPRYTLPISQPVMDPLAVVTIFCALRQRCTKSGNPVIVDMHKDFQTQWERIQVEMGITPADLETLGLDPYTGPDPSQ